MNKQLIVLEILTILIGLFLNSNKIGTDLIGLLKLIQPHITHQVRLLVLLNVNQTTNEMVLLVFTNDEIQVENLIHIQSHGKTMMVLLLKLITT